MSKSATHIIEYRFNIRFLRRVTLFVSFSPAAICSLNRLRSLATDASHVPDVRYRNIWIAEK
ncbi:MAG: hypothetical protein HN919_02965 [Verrucomicrobia bacterium]|nr:hypothetical protein [Verrucomicrobiota bacterium]MBT7065237.1 hypothetical protein [Verrucomicrobiota bacterium]MBT7700647.1 hypothetical protein [Verrucomicrobiota bacterium]